MRKRTPTGGGHRIVRRHRASAGRDGAGGTGRANILSGREPDRFVAQAPSASVGRYYERYDTPALELDGAIVADEESFFGYNAMR